MSKERAQRRAEREREAGIRRAARAAEQERRERRRARQRRVRSAVGFLGGGQTGQPTGTLARRQRSRTRLLMLALLVANVLLWFVRPDWEARLAAAVLSVLAFPVLRLFLVSRR